MACALRLFTTLMNVDAEVSIYPLTETYLEHPVHDFTDILKRHGCAVENGPLSLLAKGELPAVFEALRPGGLYGVVDHTRRHMEPDSAANVRRVDPVAAIEETLRAGFEFVDYSDLHYRPGDDLSLEVGDERVSGRTDRFTLLFRKPQE